MSELFGLGTIVSVFSSNPLISLVSQPICTRHSKVGGPTQNVTQVDNTLFWWCVFYYVFLAMTSSVSNSSISFSSFSSSLYTQLEMHAFQPKCDDLGCKAADPVYTESEPEGRPQLRALPAGQRWERWQIPGWRTNPSRVPAANQQGCPVLGGTLLPIVSV